MKEISIAVVFLLVGVLAGCSSSSGSNSSDAGAGPDATVDASGQNYDAGLADASIPDAATPDAATPDAGLADASIPDAATDGGAMDAGDPCSPNPCMNLGSCIPSGSTYMCFCAGNWTGPTCATCSPIACSSRPNYFKGRFVYCAGANGFECQGGPNTSCETYCSLWMGCLGPIAINQDGWSTVTGTNTGCL